MKKSLDQKGSLDLHTLVIALIVITAIAFVGTRVLNHSLAAKPKRSPKPPVSSTTSTLASTATTKKFAITKNGATLYQEYCSNASDIAAQNSTVTTVVLVVHGNSRNACDHANYILASASAAGVSNVLVIAPHFYTSSDTVPADTIYWSDGGWKSGSNSLDTPIARPWRMSSYEVADKFLAQVNKTNYPNLSHITIAGHSAGGQFVNRYAASNRSINALQSAATTKFVVSNPSSYLYFNTTRYINGALRTLSSAEIAACPGYNDYKYGLANRYAYLSSLTESQIATQYKNSPVTYLLGEEDTSTTDPELDNSCEANLEGTQRLERGNAYYQYIGQALGSDVYTNQSKLLVPGVGHTARSMYTSTQGQEALFK